MSLAERLAAEIRAGGPITIAQYMTRCLHDPIDGYYATRPAIGEGGDFITAPQVSQMFGELVGAWLIETWRRQGASTRFVLAEAGPGDGTLMGDILRTAKLAPDFLGAAELWLVETSDPLRALQAGRLAEASPRWAGGLAELPDDAPLLLVANEFLDCLPVRQFVRSGEGWAERLVGLDDDGGLAFGRTEAVPAPGLPPAPEGTVLEISAAQVAVGAEIGQRIAAQGGAALLIDYGRDAPGFGDTLQALKGHGKAHPLASPGQADLTVHADFPAVLAAARLAQVETGLLSQGAFLRRLGVEERAAVLARAHPKRAKTIARQLQRLTAADQMGELFKVAAVWRGAVPPAFEPAR
ncbi:MAG: class I SAM-dependent methyltransferase [Caulobacterales bacterium]